MNIPFLHVSDHARLNELISRASTVSHAGHLALLRAARDGIVDMAFMDRLAEAPIKALERAVRPAIVVVGDDDYASTGPAGWTAWQRLKYWGRGALVHATGADAWSYQLAIEMAQTLSKVLLIETDTAHAQAWADALRKHRIRAIGLVPPSGTHPVLPAREALQ